MLKTLFAKAMWIGSEPVAPQQVPPTRQERRNRAEKIGNISVRPGSFPRNFWLTARSLSRNPLAPSISVRDCSEYFGRDLNRYVPTPGFRLIVTRLHAVVDFQRRFLDGGDWDLKRNRISMRDSAVFKLCNDIAPGTPFRETETYARLKHNMLQGRPEQVAQVVLDTQDKLDAYYEYLHSLMESIRTHGLRPGADLRS